MPICAKVGILFYILLADEYSLVESICWEHEENLRRLSRTATNLVASKMV